MFYSFIHHKCKLATAPAAAGKASIVIYTYIPEPLLHVIPILVVQSASFWVLNVTPAKMSWTRSRFFSFSCSNTSQLATNANLAHPFGLRFRRFRQELSLCNLAPNTPRNYSNWRLRSKTRRVAERGLSPWQLWEVTEIAKREAAEDKLLRHHTCFVWKPGVWPSGWAGNCQSPGAQRWPRAVQSYMEEKANVPAYLSVSNLRFFMLKISYLNSSRDKNDQVGNEIFLDCKKQERGR